MDVKEFRADFVEAVNGVLEKHFKKNIDKGVLTYILEHIFESMFQMLSIADKIKGGKWA